MLFKDLGINTEIMAKEYKKLEIRKTSLVVEKELYNLEFNSKKQKETEIWDRFEEKIRLYESLPYFDQLTEKEKCDSFMTAILQVLPGAIRFNSV